MQYPGKTAGGTMMMFEDDRALLANVAVHPPDPFIHIEYLTGVICSGFQGVQLQLDLRG